MALIAANCPSCGADIQIPDDRDSFDCKYCGQKIMIERDEPATAPQRTQSPDVKNYLALAETAAESGNSEDAEKYFSLVLERDPGNVTAWIGKAMAAGWQSNIRTTRLDESANYIKRAVKIGLKDPTQIGEMIDGMNSLANAVTMANWKHVKEFHEVEGTIGECLPNVQQAVELLGLAWSIKKDPTIAKNIAYILNPEDKVDRILGKFLMEHNPPILQLYNQCVQWLQANDSQWVAEQKKAKSGCFVATATMGDDEHPTVVILRQFRDELLETSTAGRTFINAYYKIGPYIADVIRQSDLLKRLSYVLLVKPVSLLAEWSLCYSRRNRNDPNRERN
jgi:DNA-directed RNA polymerase subunit RPC12/RpoP